MIQVLSSQETKEILNSQPLEGDLLNGLENNREDWVMEDVIPEIQEVVEERERKNKEKGKTS